jgi:hypothetical protein
LLALCGKGGPAPAFEELGGELRASEACEARVSLRRRGSDDAPLTVGERYRLLGRNRKDGPWLQVLVPGLEPEQRWVEARCGTLVETEREPRASDLQPFFDEVDGGRHDPSPPRPRLTALDHAMLEACGRWGSHPRRGTFRSILDRPELAPELRAVHAALSGADRHPRTGWDRFKDELVEVWFAADGFAHVFCGEPESDGLDGLHYRARYLELQEQGLAGLLDVEACPAAEIDPPVYTIGVRYRSRPEGLLRSVCPKSYASDLGAADLLLAGMQAWRGSRGERMCLLELPGGYRAVAVLASRGVRTLYPDSTPRCDDGGRPASCACSTP